MRNHTWLACCMYVVGLSGYKQKVFDMMSRTVAGRCMGDRCTINSVNKNHCLLLVSSPYRKEFTM